MKFENLEPRIIRELQLSPIENNSLDLIDRILIANRISRTLEEYREKASGNESDWQLRDGLVLYRNRLVVPEDENLRIDLIKEVH